MKKITFTIEEYVELAIREYKQHNAYIPENEVLKHFITTLISKLQKDKKFNPLEFIQCIEFNDFITFNGHKKFRNFLEEYRQEEAKYDYKLLQHYTGVLENQKKSITYLKKILNDFRKEYPTKYVGYTIREEYGIKKEIIFYLFHGPVD